MLHLHGFTRAFLVQKPNLNVHINTLNRLCMQRKTHLISLSLIRSSFSLSNPNENDPETFSQAMSSKESNLWYNAMRDEMHSMASNQVWYLVEFPVGANG